MSGDERCMVCGGPALHGFRHCAECLEAETFRLLEQRGGLMFVTFEGLAAP